MILDKFHIANFRKFPSPSTLRLERDVTLLLGPVDTAQNTLLDGLRLGINGCPLQQEDFPAETSAAPAPCLLGLEFHGEITTPFEELAGKNLRLKEDHLLNRRGRLEIVRQFERDDPRQPVFCLRAVHPVHPELQDLLQLKNQELIRRLTASPAPVRGVDRRSNRAIRDVLRAHYLIPGELEERLIPLVNGDALILRDILLRLMPHAVSRKLRDWSELSTRLLPGIDREFGELIRPRTGRTPPSSSSGCRFLLLALPGDHPGSRAECVHRRIEELLSWQNAHGAQIVISSSWLELAQMMPDRCRRELRRGPDNGIEIHQS